MINLTKTQNIFFYWCKQIISSFSFENMNLKLLSGVYSQDSHYFLRWKWTSRFILYHFKISIIVHFFYFFHKVIFLIIIDSLIAAATRKFYHMFICPHICPRWRFWEIWCPCLHQTPDRQACERRGTRDPRMRGQRHSKTSDFLVQGKTGNSWLSGK